MAVFPSAKKSVRLFSDAGAFKATGDRTEKKIVGVRLEACRVEMKPLENGV